jgi:PAS domain S-box-containing protein
VTGTGKNKQKKHSRKNDLEELRFRLIESEARCRNLFKFAPVGIYEIDPRTMRFIEANDVMCEMLGFTREELLGLDPMELLDNEGRERFRELVKAILAKKTTPKVVEYRVKTKDGRQMYAVLNVTVNYRNGKPGSVSLFARNITTRKRAGEEHELHSSEIQADRDGISALLGSMQDEGARLNALYQLSQMLEATVDEMAGFILEHGIALTQSKIGFVGFLNEDESIYTLHAVSKDVVKECAVVDNPFQWHIAGAGIWADAIRQRRTLFVNDYSKPHPSKKGLPPGHPPLNRLMVVPVSYDKKIVAVAGMGNKDSDYDQSDERQITLLLRGMWEHVQRNRSREALKEAYDELEQRVEQRTAELTALNAALKEEIAERKKAGEALRKSEEKYRSLFDSMTEGFALGKAIFDEKGNPVDHVFLEANDAFERQTGIKKEVILNKSVRKAIPGIENDPADWIKVYGEVAKTGKPVQFENYARHEKKWYSLYVYSPMKDHFAVIFSDITERKNHQERIKNLNLLLDTITSSAKFIIATIDSDYRFTYFNKEHKENIKRITGKDNKIGMSIKALFSEMPVQQKMALELWRRVLNGETVEQVVEFGPKDYKRFYQTRYVPILDKRGKVVGAGEVSNDITGIIETEEALRQSEERHRLLAETMLQGVVHQSADGTIIAMNPAAERILGKTPAEFLGGSSVKEEHHTVREDGSPFPGMEHPSMAALRSGQPVHGVVMGLFNPRRNERRWISIDAVPIFRPGEPQPVEVYTIFEDITERKQAEEVLKRDKETFEKLVEERTAELMKAHLELEKAKRLSDIGTLASMVAHELRNPLAAIGMASHNIRRKANNAQLDKHLASIDDKVAESDQIINNLLFYSRLKSPHFEGIDISDMLEECIESARDKSKREISIISNMGSLRGVSIEADPVQIREVFINILNNAYDAVPVDKGEIKIDTEVDDKHITIFVEDNGPGISQDVIDKVFDPFFTTKAKGTGLGLSVCRQIVIMHDGEIGLRGGIGKGACIFVRLPKEREREIHRKNP